MQQMMYCSLGQNGAICQEPPSGNLAKLRAKTRQLLCKLRLQVEGDGRGRASGTALATAIDVDIAISGRLCKCCNRLLEFVQ